MTAIEQYFVALDDLVGGADATFYEIAHKNSPLPLTVVRYEDIPESGESTSFSFGLSHVDRIEWKFGKPELMISVNSLDTAWPLAMGEVIRRARGDNLFELGTFFDFGEQISEESKMSGFFIYSNSLLGSEDSAIVLEDRKINVVQLYPAFESEYDLVKEIGIEKFYFDSGIDFMNVTREPVV